jgi:hypothetical protein
VLDNLEHPLVAPEILRRTSARDNERVVLGLVHFVESDVQLDVAATGLQIRLVAAKALNRSFACFVEGVLRTDGVDPVADRIECLERHHGLVVFNEIANQQ